MYLIEKTDEILTCIKKLVNPVVLLEALIVFAVLACLHHFDLDNLIELRRCLFEQRWVDASYPFFRLLVVLEPWLLGLTTLFITAYYWRGGYSSENIVKYVLRRYILVTCCVVLISFIHIVLFDEFSSLFLILNIGALVTIWIPSVIITGLYVASK